MSGFGIINLVVLLIGLRLFGFIGPCSIGSSLVFVKYLEGKRRRQARAGRGVYCRASALSRRAGNARRLNRCGFHRPAEGRLDPAGRDLYRIGLLYLVGQADVLMTSLGPSLARISEARGSVGLGLLFGLNIPAGAAPLIFALLGMAAAGGVSGGALAAGFVSLGLFGFALSLPLVVAVLFEPARQRHIP